MKPQPYYGNYLGVVITGGNKDPEGRGRCQIFVPHVMPALYEGWNEPGNDIAFDIVGNGIPTALSPDIVERLKKVLPWSECAAPIVGSSPSTFVSSSGAASETVRNVERVTPISGQSGELSADEAVAKGLLNSTGWCARGANNILSYYTTGRGMATSGANAKNMGPILQQRYSMSKVSDTGVYQNGDTKVMTKDGCPGCAGHIETYMNGTWYSDHKQRASLEGRGYTATGLFRLPSSTALGGDLASAETAQEGAEEELPPVNPSGIAGGPNSIDTNMKADPTEETAQYEDGAAGASEALARDRQSRFGQEISQNQEQILGRIQALANREVGSNPAAQQAFIETIVNRAYFSNRSLNTIIYEGAYGFKGNDTATPSSSIRTAFNNVIAGGNTTNLATDAGYNLPRAGPGGGNFVTGNSAKQVTGVMDLQTGRFVTDQALLNKLNTEGDRSGRYEYFVRQDRATTRAGIEQYAQENGIEQSTAIAQNAANQPTIQHPTPFPRNDGPDTNYQALGMFGYASEGTAVWCFFREGNPLFPVYFAASYGQKEWSNMYSYGSPGLGAGVGPKGALDNTEKMRMSLYGGGFESAQISEGEEESSLEANYEFQVYGKNGSNLLFAKDHTQFNSTYNHNQRVSGDFHEITEANKEQRVRGDKNSYIEQDMFITVGNWSQDSIEASDEIQEYINEAMKIKSDAGG